MAAVVPIEVPAINLVRGIIATMRIIKGMETFNRPIILIAGGYDKHTKLDKFMKTVKARVQCLILLGNAAARFKDEAEKAGIKTIVLADDMPVSYTHLDVYKRQEDTM